MAKAITLTGVGVASLRLSEIPDAVAGPGEILIAVEAASINPVDRAAVDPGYGDKMPGSAPWILGWDLAGRVTALGSGVDDIAVGDRVLGFSQWFKGGPGLHRSLVALPRDNVAVAGDAVPADELTTFGLNGLTALQVLDAAGLEEGQTLLVIGASGGVGGFVAQLADSRGITVLTAGRDTPPADFAGMELDGLINTAPADPTSYLEAVRDDGVATSVTTPAEAERGIRSSRVGVRVDRAGLETVAGLAERGVLRTTVAAAFPAEQAAWAFEADGSAGRIVLTF
ncbi:MAG TPA: alcohol dehydrogenase catalytic domain-containing protein [Pseudolysinimonas sp.]|jgi:D-arabinose 1-dehydrogenase-like Zn-dependent alcohol dehydrogenase|nr:alcohol dehydrogenase catalytic domain-containing protein [Pseudolysinimonas sp.]